MKGTTWFRFDFTADIYTVQVVGDTNWKLQQTVPIAFRTTGLQQIKAYSPVLIPLGVQVRNFRHRDTGEAAWDGKDIWNVTFNEPMNDVLTSTTVMFRSWLRRVA